MAGTGNGKTSPLFSDHITYIFLNDETETVADEIASDSPSTPFLVRYRTRYFDDLLLKKIESGIKQIAILGSGLDTRSLRFRLPDVVYYEIDQKHVLSYKSCQLEQFGYDLNSTMIPCDYTKVDFVSNLEKKALILWKKLPTGLILLKSHWTIFQKN